MMKKIFYTLTFTAVVSSVCGQGLFNKIKTKITDAASKNAQQGVATQTAAATTATAPDGSAIKYTDPAGFGTVIKTFDKTYMQAHVEGYVFWFSQYSVINNQFQATVNDYQDARYFLNNGALTPAGDKPDFSLINKVRNGSEFYLQSVDCSQTDYDATLMKTPSIASGQQPGRATQTYTFNGKQLATYITASVAHNADSSAVALLGMGAGKGGVMYSLITSTGIHVSMPKVSMGLPLISPDGKQAGGYYGSTGQVQLASGISYNIGPADAQKIWLRNTGSVFNLGPDNTLKKNGVVFATANVPIDPKLLFISADEKTMCWGGYRGLYFSDGSVFENGQSPVRVTIDGKEVIYFLATDNTEGKLYLCHHDL